MKKIINDPSNFVEESIQGLIVSHPNIYSFAKDNKSVITRTIKANNKYQFELIETLYLRLGYSMIIEWGYSHYLPNLGGVSASSI